MLNHRGTKNICGYPVLGGGNMSNRIGIIRDCASGVAEMVVVYTARIASRYVKPYSCVGATDVRS